MIRRDSGLAKRQAVDADQPLRARQAQVSRTNKVMTPTAGTLGSNPSAPWPFNSTMRAEGRPSGVAVARVMAPGLVASEACASRYQLSNRAIGSVDDCDMP